MGEFATWNGEHTEYKIKRGRIEKPKIIKVTM